MASPVWLSCLATPPGPLPLRPALGRIGVFRRLLKVQPLMRSGISRRSPELSGGISKEVSQCPSNPRRPKPKSDLLKTMTTCLSSATARVLPSEASLISMGCLILFLKIWQPKQLWLSPALRGNDESASTMPPAKLIDPTPLTSAEMFTALLPWIILCAILLIWGTNWFKAAVNPIFTWNYAVPELHNMINKVAPVVPTPTKEAAVFSFTYLSFTGTGMLIAAVISGFIMGLSPSKIVSEYGRTIKLCAYSLITISAMLAIGTLTRLSGVDATLGLAFAATGVLYPFFGTLLGWLGVALTGSDTASNILFGNLQKITSEQLGLSPILMAAANSSGGVMGKMIDAQSIVVASTATNWVGHEGTILRFVFKHSIALACLVGLFVMLQAYVYPFTEMVLK